MSYHKQTPVTYQNQTIHIDTKILPTLQKLWKHNITTTYSCQGTPNTTPPEPGYIAFPTNNDLQKTIHLLNLQNQTTTWKTQHKHPYNNYPGQLYETTINNQHCLAEIAPNQQNPDGTQTPHYVLRIPAQTILKLHHQHTQKPTSKTKQTTAQ